MTIPKLTEAQRKPTDEGLVDAIRWLCSKLVEQAQELDHDAARVLYDNLWELYRD